MAYAQTVLVSLYYRYRSLNYKFIDEQSSTHQEATCKVMVYCLLKRGEIKLVVHNGVLK